jgi:hypothetical protein
MLLVPLPFPLWLLLPGSVPIVVQTGSGRFLSLPLFSRLSPAVTVPHELLLVGLVVVLPRQLLSIAVGI